MTRVLIVDDCADTAALLAKMFQVSGDHEVAIAHDGPRALEMASSFRPQAAIIDLQLLAPMSGYALAAKLRDLFGRSCRLAAYSGSDLDGARAPTDLFDAHFVKPTASIDLIQFVNGEKP